MLGVGKGRKHRTAPPEVSTTARSILQSPPQKHGIKLAEIVVTAIFAILPVLPFVPVVWKVILSLLVACRREIVSMGFGEKIGLNGWHPPCVNLLSAFGCGGRSNIFSATGH